MAFILYLLRVYQYASLDSLPTFSAEDSKKLKELTEYQELNLGI